MRFGMRQIHFLAFSILTDSALAATNLVTSVAEMNALHARNQAQDAAFEFVGRVNWVGEENVGEIHYGLELDSGVIRLLNKPPCTASAPPKAGHVVRVRGQADLDDRGRLWLCVHDYAVIGVERPPAPLPLTAGEVLRSPGLDNRLVTVRGKVRDAYLDELDESRWSHLILSAGGVSLVVSVDCSILAPSNCIRTIGAELRVIGVVMPLAGDRRFVDPYLSVHGAGGLEILTPAPGDPFDSPPLSVNGSPGPTLIAGMGRRSVVGTVIARWNGDRLLIRTGEETIGCALSPNSPRFPVGTRVKAVGFPETDLYHFNLTRTLLRAEPNGTFTEEAPRTTTPDEILHGPTGQGGHGLRMDFHGHVVRLSGTVRGRTSDVNGTMLVLDCNDTLASVYAESDVNALENGTVLEVTGVCVLEGDNWRPSRPLPQMKGLIVVTRRPDDIRILARPPWWTPARLLVVIAALLGVLVGIFWWNRLLNRLVEKRTRALAGADLRIEERTRLAVELHDSLSQNLSGVACQVSATKNVLASNPSVLPRHLDTLERMLLSCRTELRRCLWDLRGDALETDDFAEAVRKTISPLVPSAAVSVSLSVRRADLADTVAHAVLCIIRELVANALVHGDAKSVTVSGDAAGGRLELAVTDDGKGFDPETADGPLQGHFGLAGIRDRVKRLRGKFSIESRPGAGTTATVTLPLGEEDEK